MFCLLCVIIIVICICTPLLATGLNIQPSYLVQMCIYIPHVIHIKYLVILTCSFKMAVSLVLYLIYYAAHINSHRGFILHTLMYLFFTYTLKRNSATVTYFLKFMSIYSLLLI